MDKFTASNGLEMTTHSKGAYLWEGGEFGSILGSFTLEDVQALREFFRAEEDERLGRWRWPENQNYVVYPRADHVQVVNEASGNALGVTREQAGISTGLSYAALAYFDAHPIKKPWHDAKPGELWVLDLKGSILPAEVYRLTEWRVFRPVDNPDRVYFDPTNSSIEDARRIWPQD